MEQKAASFSEKYRSWLLLAAFLLLVVWLVWLWYGKQPATPGGYQAAKPAIDTPKVEHEAPKKIKVLPKAQASKKLGLPTDVASDDNQQIIDTADIPPAPHGATTVTTMDMKTGEANTLVKVKPAPLFSFLRAGAVGVRYGITSSGDQQASVFARQDILRIGTIHLSAVAEARTMPTKGTSEAFGGAEVSHRW